MPHRCYLFTAVKSNGQTLDEGDDNVIVFARTVTLDELRKAFGTNGLTWDEAYEIPGKDVQYHIHQALYLSEKAEARAKEPAKSSTTPTKAEA